MVRYIYLRNLEFSFKMLSPIYEEEHSTLIIKIYDNEIWKTYKGFYIYGILSEFSLKTTTLHSGVVMQRINLSLWRTDIKEWLDFYLYP